MKRVVKSIIATLCVASIPAVNAGVLCEGKVQSIAFGAGSGTLTANTGYGVHYLCNFNEVQFGVHPETCKAWYSMLLTAKASGKTIKQYYERTDTNCSTLGNWAAPNPHPYYIEMVD